MSRFLFTMLPANDLGLPTCPDCARALADRGHGVATEWPNRCATSAVSNSLLT
jgi:hypothetical protein